jgi:hypothetical protein
MRTWYRFCCRVIAPAIVLTVMSACSFDEEALWPSPPDDEGEAPTSAEGAAGSSGDSPLNSLGTTSFEAPGVSLGQPTGTVVGKKIIGLREELTGLQERLAHHNQSLQSQRAAARGYAANYHGLIGAMNARLQVGTTRGNPELVAQWNRAQSELQQVGSSIANLNTLANETAATAGVATFMLDSTRATFELRGAVEEDHRQLAVLEDEVNKTTIVLDRLLNEMTDDISRTQNYFATERLNLTAMQVAIDNGEFIGGSLGNRTFGIPDPPPAGGAAALVGQRQPLAVIRFDQPDVNFEPALFTVVNAALERRPNAGFDLVAVTPSVGDPAKVALETNRSRRNAELVLRSLVNLGLPPDRVSLAATSSAEAQVNEVHVYVR